MPLMSLPSASLSDYFTSLKDTSEIVGPVDASMDPSFTLANVPYSPTNAATIPTIPVASPFDALSQWSLDSTSEYQKATAAKPNNTPLYIGIAAVVAFLLLRNR